MKNKEMNACVVHDPSNFNCMIGCLKSTDGSAQFSQKKTTVLAGAYGPADCKESRQDVDKAVVEVNFRPKLGIPGISEKYYEQFVKRAFETAIFCDNHPRALFSIIVQIMEEQGSVLACAINAVNLALQDAAVSMKFMLVSVAVGLEYDLDDDCKLNIHLNPSTEIEKVCSSVTTFVFDNIDLNLICCYENGNIIPEHYQICLEKAKFHCNDVIAFTHTEFTKKFLEDHSQS